MNKVKLFTDWVYSVATVWILLTCIANGNDPEFLIIMGIIYSSASAPAYAIVYFGTSMIVKWYQSKILTKYVVREVEVIKEIEVIKNIPSPEGIVIKNIHVQDGVYTED
tara:strand:+ start:216 stop:542 length:327 start_codon:yes stop_codon:yes gene_type:complete